MTIPELVDKFPMAGKGFALWFASNYQIEERVFNQAPLNHQILSLYKFLGYETVLDNDISIERHLENMMERLNKYDIALGMPHDFRSFEKRIITMPREDLISNFEKSRNMRLSCLSINNCLVRIDVPQQVSTPIKPKESLLDDPSDGFWDSIDQDDEAPF